MSNKIESYKCKNCGPVEFNNESQKGLHNGLCYWCAKSNYIRNDKQLMYLTQTRDLVTTILMRFAMDDGYKDTGEDAWGYYEHFEDYLKELDEQWLKNRTL